MCGDMIKPLSFSGAHADVADGHLDQAVIRHDRWPRSVLVIERRRCQRRRSAGAPRTTLAIASLNHGMRGGAMASRTMVERIDSLEVRVERLERLPARIDELTG
jgi:hypothetical protein